MVTTETPRLSVTAQTQTTVEDVLLKRRKRWLAGLFLTSTCGLLSAIFGLGISGLTLLGLHDTRGSLDVAGPILVGSALPLLMLAAHSLDRIGEIETRLKIEYCKRLGYKDDQ